MIYSERKFNKRKEPLYIIRFDTPEEADGIWNAFEYLINSKAFADSEDLEIPKTIETLKNRCLHNEPYDKDDQVSLIIYNSEICSILIKMLLACVVITGHIDKLSELCDVQKECIEANKQIIILKDEIIEELNTKIAINDDIIKLLKAKVNTANTLTDIVKEVKNLVETSNVTIDKAIEMLKINPEDQEIIRSKI